MTIALDRMILALALVGVFGGVALAQGPAFTHLGTAGGGMHGWAVAAVGDVDGDGVEDVLVGAPESGGVGQVVVVSGQTGAALFTIEGQGY